MECRNQLKELWLWIGNECENGEPPQLTSTDVLESVINVSLLNSERITACGLSVYSSGADIESDVELYEERGTVWGRWERRKEYPFFECFLILFIFSSLLFLLSSPLSSMLTWSSSSSVITLSIVLFRSITGSLFRFKYYFSPFGTLLAIVMLAFTEKWVLFTLSILSSSRYSLSN